MKLTWHIVLKDLRRLWLPLALWSMLFLYRFYLCSRLTQVAGWEPNAFMEQAMGISGCSLLIGAMNYLLVAALIFEDPLTGSRMFWATRPIAGGRLLAAKLISAALAFLLLPSVINFGWGVVRGIPAAQLAPSLWVTIVFHGMISLFAMALATLTGTTARLLLWTLLAVVAVPIFGVMKPRILAADADAIREFAVLWLLVLGCAGAIAWQFLARRIVVATAWSLSATALALTAMFFLQASFLGPSPAPSGGAPDLAVREIQIESRSDSVTVNLSLSARDWPPEFMTSNGVVRAELTWPDGEMVRATGRIEISGARESGVLRSIGLSEKRVADPDPETEEHFRKAFVLGPRSQDRDDHFASLYGYKDKKECQAFVRVPVEYSERLMQDPPRCRLWLEGELLRPELIGEIPLRAGAKLSAQGFQVVVQDVANAKRAGRTALAGRRYTMTYSRPSSTLGQPLEFRVIDGPRRLAWWDVSGGAATPFDFSGLPVAHGIEWKDVGIPQVWRTDRMVDQPERLADFTLAAVVLRPAGKWVQILTIDRLATTP